MIDTLVTSLILMAISAVTFIAYKHPDAYKKIWTYLVVLNLFVLVCVLIWNIAVSETKNKLNTFLQPDKIEIARATIDNLQTSDFWTFGIFFSIMLYLLFLSFLQDIINQVTKEPK